MFGALAKSLFGSSNDRYVKSLGKIVDRIASFEPAISAMSEDELAGQTARFRDRLSQGETLDDLLPEAFATVREAAKRTLGQRHYDVQMVGGIVLHRGEIAEMRTGEGKTLVATLATYLNALEGKGVHVVTVNDYLASRDCEWMGQVYRFLGLTTGVIVPNLSEDQRREAYNADITYATNNELGFDYLRDNMKYDRASMVQRPFNFAIVDEVDSILIDEARTPLIISGPTDDKSELYVSVDAIVKRLDESDYEKDEKQRTVTLTEDGTEKIERMLEEAGLLQGANLYDFENTAVVHHVNQALRANAMFRRDIDYIVKDGKVIIIDEFTGRMMDGRRWSDGLHQAVEAKEGVQIEPENQTLASITFQNYFRMYPKLGGMTGTAATEATEFYEIYKMNVVTIPTNRPVQRIDEEDSFYKNLEDKFRGIAKTIKLHAEQGQPVLVGTVSIEKSEMLSEFLNQEGVPHAVLNARFHESEAHIVAQAGRKGAVTIATNMAGRGTDIQLGGNLDMRLMRWTQEQRAMGNEITPEAEQAESERLKADIERNKQAALEAGGLFVLGTERHESRRIDNQLRGRTGRQGDPGTSKFYLATDDDLLRIFAGDRLASIMETFKVAEGEAISHPWLNRAVETSQKRVEQRNYEIRKNLLKYDDVVNDQRKAVFEQRQEFLDTEDLSELVGEFRRDTVSDLVETHIPPKAYAEQWDVEGLDEQVRKVLGLDAPVRDWAAEEGVSNEEIEERLQAAAEARAVEREAQIGAGQMRGLERQFLLQMIDMQWREHLVHLDHLRGVIGLRGYGQRDPLNEYKTEAFSLFETLLVNLRQNVTRWVMTVEFRFEPPPPPAGDFQEIHLNPLTGENEMNNPAAQLPEGGLSGDDRARLPVDALPPGWERTSRNADCPCGSGRKFKHCHGALV